MGSVGPKLLLDRRASAPRTPSCPAASRTTPEGTPVRLTPCQSEQGAPPPSRTTPGPPVVVEKSRFWWLKRTSSATIAFVIFHNGSEEVRDGHGRWVGSASGSDHLRCGRHRHGGGVAGSCSWAQPGQVPQLAGPGPGRPGAGPARGVGGGGLHRLAVCDRGDHRGWLRGVCGRAGRYPSRPGPQAPGQNGPHRRQVVTRVAGRWRPAPVVDPARVCSRVARAVPALQVPGRSAHPVDPAHPRRVVPTRCPRARCRALPPRRPRPGCATPTCRSVRLLVNASVSATR